VCCFGEDIDGERSMEDNNDAFDSGKISIDKGGDEGIDDEEGICENDDDNDSEVIFDGRLEVSSG
jgi:hypothetical protein